MISRVKMSDNNMLFTISLYMRLLIMFIDMVIYLHFDMDVAYECMDVHICVCVYLHILGCLHIFFLLSLHVNSYKRFI